MLGLDLSLRSPGPQVRVAPGGIGAPPVPTVVLPRLTTTGASYHAVYALSRLMPDYAGPLAYVVDEHGAAVDIGAGKAAIGAADLPQPITPVWGLYDQTGNARDLQQPLSDHQPRLRAEVTVGTGLALSFAGIAYDTRWASLSGPQAVATVDRTEFFLLDPTTSIQSAVWSEHDNGSDVVRDSFIDGDGLLQAGQSDTGRHVRTGPQVVAVVEVGAQHGIAYIDGVGYPIGNGRDLGSTARVTLGASSFGAQFNANLRLGAYVSIAGALTTADVAAVSSALLARYRVTTDHAVSIVHVGDSIVQGIGAEDTLGWRAAIDPLLTRRARWWNLGIAGKTLAACFADRGKHEGVLVAAGKINLALVDGGINDIGFGTGGEQLYSGTTTPYVAALKAMGYRVAVVTLLPQASSNYPRPADAIDAERVAYNALARANGAGADIVIDRAAVTQMGTYPASCLDATLYSQTIGGVGIHPTTHGYRLLAPAYAAAINAI